MERSIYSTRFCFGEALLLDGKIEKAAYDVFIKWFEYAEKCVRNQIDLIVYVRATPEVVYERIQKRNRAEEKSVPFEYICRLHDLHEQWLAQSANNNNNKNYESILPVTSSGIPIFILDANLPSPSILREYERFKAFLQKSQQFNLDLKED